MFMLTCLRTGVVCLLGFGTALAAAELNAKTLIDRADRLMDQNCIADAVKVYGAAIRDARASGHLIQAGIALDHLGVAYNMLGEDQKAEISFTEALTALLAVEGEQGENLIRTYMDLAALYRKLNRYTRAHHFAEKALGAVERGESANARQTALALVLLASIEAEQRKLIEGEAHCFQALETLDKAGLGSTHEWAGAANNLATILVATGRPEHGRMYLREALTRGERNLVSGSDRLPIAQIAANLAHLELQLHRFDEAEANLRRALDVFEGSLGPDHPRTGELLLDYARLCRATKRKIEARQFEQRARECLKAYRHGIRDNTVDVSDLHGR